MTFDARDILELIDLVPWGLEENVRLFWVKIPEGSRDAIAGQIACSTGESAVVSIVLRESLFNNANAVLSDFAKLIENNKHRFEGLTLRSDGKLSIIILLKQDFKLSQISSPVTLPQWFPILGGKETFLKISDLLQQAEVGLLHCPEAGIELLAETLFELETSLAQRLSHVIRENKNKIQSLIDTLYPREKSIGGVEAISNFLKHLEAVNDPRGYRPNARNQKSLISLLLSSILRSTPDNLASLADKTAKAMDDSSGVYLKPTLFSVMFRPTNKIEITTRNWHSILMAVFQAYQIMNAAAHAGEYPSYPISLIHSTSRDLVRFLNESNNYLACIMET